MPQDAAFVLRACRREAAVVHQDLETGLTSVATIAATAPLLGFFGTLLGIVNSFRGYGGERSAILAFTAQFLSESLWPSVFGLLVAILSLLIHQHLRSNLRRLDQEMELAAEDTVDLIAAYRGKWTFAPMLVTIQPPSFGMAPNQPNPVDRRIAAGTLLAAWAVQCIWYFCQGSLPWRSAVWAGFQYVATALVVCTLLAVTPWIRFLRRRPGALFLLASTLVLIWSLIELAIV